MLVIFGQTHTSPQMVRKYTQDKPTASVVDPHYRGMQLRYVYFLNGDTQDELIDECEVEINRGDYPKQKDLKWKQRTADGWVRCSKPDFDPEELTYNDSHRENYQEQQEQVELGTFNHGQRISHYVPDSDEKYQLSTRKD
jgi:hypothetical protein